MDVCLALELKHDVINGDIADMAAALAGAGFDVDMLPTIYHIQYLRLTRANDFPKRGFYSPHSPKGEIEQRLKALKERR